MKKVVWVNKSNKQLCVTIPKASGIKEGDTVSVEKEKIKTIVYSSTTADMFHYGHLQILEKANTLGDLSICGVLTDEAIKAFKEEPVANLKERMAIVSALRCLDMVMVQKDLDPTENLKKIHSQFKNAKIIVVRGSKWKKMAGDDYIKKIGGKIVLLPFYERLSVENNISKIFRLHDFRRKTAISYKTREKTVLRGYNLSELAEEGYTFCDALFVLFQGRIPIENEEKMLEYETAEFLEHSMSPSAAAAISVISGRPYLPAAIAAGVMTFGGAHGPGAAHGYMMGQYIERAIKEGKSIEEMGKILVDEHFDAGLPVMGFGQPQHTDGDPRAEPTHIKQEELGLNGVYLKLQRSIEKHFHKRRKKEGKSFVAVNMIGAGNTALADLGFSPNAAWSIGCVCRGFSCAAHALYTLKKGRAWAASKREPMVQMLDLSMIKYKGPEDRPVPKMKDRQKYAKKQKEEGDYKKWSL